MTIGQKLAREFVRLHQKQLARTRLFYALEIGAVHILCSSGERRRAWAILLMSMASILASLHMQTADDLFGGPPGTPRTDRLIAAGIQWVEKVVEKIDSVFSGK